jgi:hypothetical protein
MHTVAIESITNPSWTQEQKQKHIDEMMEYEKKSIINVENICH